MKLPISVIFLVHCPKKNHDQEIDVCILSDCPHYLEHNKDLEAGPRQLKCNYTKKDGENNELG